MLSLRRRHRHEGRSGRWDHGFEDLEALGVVGAAHRRPFQRHLRQSAPQEAADAEGCFDDAEDRFDGLLALFVAGAAGLGGGAVGEPLGARGVIGRRSRIGSGFELHAGAFVADRAVSAGVGEELRAVAGHGDVAHPELLAARGQLEDLREGVGQQCAVLPAELVLTYGGISWSGWVSARR